MEPLISVIVPVYNVEDYLERCIKSVLGQTYNNIELILVDDGSTDLSGEICDRYACDDHRVRVFHKENGGVSSARNYGLDQIKGDFVSFLDSDDYFDPDMLEYLYGLMTETGADYAKCPARLVGWPLAIPEEYPESDYKVYSKEEAVKHTLIGELGFTGSACHNVYKKSAIDNLRFLKARSNEDLDFITHVSVQAGNVVVTKCSKYNYVYHEEGGHATFLGQYMQELDMVYDRLKELLEKEMPDMLQFLDVRYVRNALDALQHETLNQDPPFDTVLSETSAKIRQKKISRKYLNKTEKLLISVLPFGLGLFQKTGKFINDFKKKRAENA